MRHQLPSYSPLSAGKLARAAAGSLLGGTSSCQALEQLLVERYAADEAIVVSSGTQALQIALTVARGDGDEPVALPAYSCYDLVSAAVGAEASAVFYDIDPVSLTPNAASLASAMAAGARVLVAGYLYGFPLDWDALTTRSRDAGAILIEDAAQGLGTDWRGRSAGSYADMSILSFGRGKGWTGGTGGALLVRGEELTERARRLRGTLPDSKVSAGPRAATVSAIQWLLGRPALFGIPSSVPGLKLGETVYKDPSTPTKSSSFACRAVLEHAALAAEEAAARREGGGAWRRRLESRGGTGYELCEPLGDGACGYLRYPLVMTDAHLADSVVERLGRHGVARGYPIALPRLPQAATVHRAIDGESFEGAEALADRLVTLPSHSLTGTRDQEEVARVLAG